VSSTSASSASKEVRPPLQRLQLPLCAVCSHLSPVDCNFPPAPSRVLMFRCRTS
jgi:hypothetical protein